MMLAVMKVSVGKTRELLLRNCLLADQEYDHDLTRGLVEHELSIFSRYSIRASLM